MLHFAQDTLDPVEVKMFPAKVHWKVKNFLVKMAYSKAHIVMYIFLLVYWYMQAWLWKNKTKPISTLIRASEQIIFETCTKRIY